MRIPPTFRTIALIILLAAAAAAPSSAQLFPQSGNLVDTDGYASLTVFHPGSTGFIAVKGVIKDEWHINSDSPLDKYLIPTILEVTAPDGIIIKGILYPEPEMLKLEISDQKMPLYHGTVNFGAIIEISGDIKPGKYRIRAALRYQGCNNMTCLEPAVAIEEITVRVGTMEEPGEMTHDDIFLAPPFIDGTGAQVTAGSGDDDNSFGDMLEQHGLILAFILIYIGGLALNLTPCVFPLIPITVSYFVNQSDGKTSRTFVLTLFYVLGMSITYSILGMIAATTGGLFGSALQNPLVIFFIAAVLVGLATSMFGLWEFRMPTFLSRRTGQAKQGRWGAIMMGLTVGIVAAPCIGPFVLGLLIYVGETGKPVLGFLMFFTLAWGMGTPFILLGTLSGSLARPGHWMVWVKKIFGFILIMMALYFARHILGSTVTNIGYVIISLTAGLMLWPFDRTPQEGNAFKIIKIIVGAVWLISATFILTMPGGPFRAALEHDGVEWEEFSEARIAEAKAEGRPVMIDFSAGWCIPCRELDHKTFTNEAVIDYSESFVRLKMDLTSINGEKKQIKRDFGIRGVPTIIFLDTSGEEKSDARITGFIGPGLFLERMKGVYKKE
ncbi:MAG: thioredoxin family protein [Candidatus Krumholzibacteria bacterium]|nr:thioredoxin family protein [Candidatus Krumholzibacteria bacterium]